MINRRSLFAGAVGFGAFLSSFSLVPFPLRAAPAEATPHVYLARSVFENGLETETWRHTIDREWKITAVFWPECPYEERYRIADELYNSRILHAQHVARH